MPSRAEINAHRLAQNVVSEQAKRAVRALWVEVRNQSPEVIRDTFLDLMPSIVSTYGNASAEVAREYFESLTGMESVEVPQVSGERVASQVRYRASSLWTPTQGDFTSSLLVDVDKYVKEYGRETVARSSSRNRVTYARVPAGGKTCAFCLMLASRDAAYSSRRAAGDRSLGNEFHGDCDCEIVPLRDGDDRPEGYDPDALREIYKSAWTPGADAKDVAYNIRRQFPELLTDGIT